MSYDLVKTHSDIFNKLFKLEQGLRVIAPNEAVAC